MVHFDVGQRASGLHRNGLVHCDGGTKDEQSGFAQLKGRAAGNNAAVHVAERRGWPTRANKGLVVVALNDTARDDLHLRSLAKHFVNDSNFGRAVVDLGEIKNRIGHMVFVGWLRWFTGERVQ